MASTVYELIRKQPTNKVQDTGYTSSSNKSWTQRYPAIKSITVHTAVQDGRVYADFESAFLPLGEDDHLRLSMPAYPPNERSWRLEMEADAALWFNTEISNVVLAGWNQYPKVVQTSQTKPPSEEVIPEEVDSTYAIRSGHHKVPLVIGEMKRNLINAGQWQRGQLTSGSQRKLSQELQGYAHKYECPQMFCFDGKTLLLLQFCATRKDQLDDENCNVDCWVIPRDCGISLRDALYRLLTQGFRRYQGMLAIADFKCDIRQWYNGRPLWAVPDTRPVQYTSNEPSGFQRSVDAATGALIWTHPQIEATGRETRAVW